MLSDEDKLLSHWLKENNLPMKDKTFRMVNLSKKAIGVDVSSKILVMSFINKVGKYTILNVCNHKADIKRCLKTIDVKSYKIVVEATGSYRGKVLYYAYLLGFEVYLVNDYLLESMEKQEIRLARPMRKIHG